MLFRSLEQAQAESHKAQKQQMPAKYSKVSQKFFIELLNLLGKINKADFAFGEHEEHVYLENNKRIYLDFLHIPSKKVIEFDGKYWHEFQEEQDKYRDYALKTMGYKILRIPETYNKRLWDKYLDNAVKFISESNPS